MQKVGKKLQKARVDLQKMNLKKSGQNKFTGFDYYELVDILPAINNICLEANLMTIFAMNKEQASLKIYDIESDEFAQFETPVALPDIKGANAVQNLGGAITYLRRYLMLTAFEIVEQDVNDALIGKEPFTPKHPNTQPQEFKKSATSGGVEIIPFGDNKGQRWDNLNDGDLMKSSAYYTKKVAEGGQYADKNKRVLDYINSILEQRITI